MNVATDRRRFGWWKVLTSGMAFAMMIATFEPHFENLPVLESVLTLFIPELTLLASATFLILAVRTGVFNLISRHRAVFAVLSVLLWWATSTILAAYRVEPEAEVSTSEVDMMESAEFPPSDSLDPNTSFLSKLSATRTRIYTFDQAPLTRRDMLLRAIEAFDGHDFEKAASYLRASKAFFPDDGSNEAADAALNFLSSRRRYLQNHHARIDQAAADGRLLAPVRLYMLRAASQLERDDQKAPELIELKQRVRSAGQDALRVIDGCTMENQAPAAGTDGRNMINLVLDAMGGLPTWTDPTAGAEWCRRLRTEVARSGAADAFQADFRTLTRNLWGGALDHPDFEEESGPPPPQPTGTDPMDTGPIGDGEI